MFSNRNKKAEYLLLTGYILFLLAMLGIATLLGCNSGWEISGWEVK